MSKKKNVYDADSIQHPGPLEAVRMRPGMYIGTTDIKGLHHLVNEIVDNSIDEALIGVCDTIRVTIHEDDSLSVEDNGRGIPCGKNSAGVEVLQLTFSELHAGGKFNNDAYEHSGGLHGVGTTVVNALSTYCEVESRRNGALHRLVFVNQSTDGLQYVDKIDKNITGTRVRFSPDPKIFDETQFDYNRLKEYLIIKAYLTPSVTFVLHDERSNDTDEIRREGGIVQMLEENTKNYKNTTDVLYIKNKETKTDIELAIRFMNSSESVISSFVNAIPTSQGGSHLDGCNRSIAKIINALAVKLKLTPAENLLKVSDIKDGLGLVLSIKYPEISFESQTKDKLSKTEIYKDVSGALASDDDIKEAVNMYTKGNTKALNKSTSLASVIFSIPNIEDIIKRFVTLRDSKEHTKTLKDSLGKKGKREISTKIKWCDSKNPEECELYIVEGDSAGGTMIAARNMYNQAIVKLRGKILNVSKASLKNIYEMESVRNMLIAFGTGAGPDFDIKKLNFNKIIITTDADTDGSHIRALIFNFMWNFCRPLITEGKVYVSVLPLYGITDTRTGKIKYAYNRKELNEILEEQFKERSYKITRYKGLGEMNADQLHETAMNPNTRKLIQVVMDENMTEEQISEEMEKMFGKETIFRKDIIDKSINLRKTEAIREV